VRGLGSAAIKLTATIFVVGTLALVAQPALAQSFCSVATGTACTTDADCPIGEECQVFVDDDITTSQVWTSDNTYRLTGIRYILNGATLTIEPGTVIRSEPNERRCAVDGDVCSVDADCTDGSDNADPCLNDPGTLIVTRGTRLEAAGTDQLPIVFTNLEDDNLFANSEPDPDGPYATLQQAIQINSTWGGLIMLGRGYVANDTDTTPPAPDPRRELIIEGLQDRGRCSETFTNCRLDGQCTGGSDVCDLGVNFYGNCAASLSPDQCDDDNSGVLDHVSIRYGGFELGSANEINGLTLGAVGRGTELDYVEVFSNFDDGVELFGGAVDIKHFVLVNNGDDDVDYDEGWRGRGQFLFTMKGILISSDPRGGEHDGATGGDSGQPRAAPTICNATYIGAGGTGTGLASDPFYDPAEDYGAQQDANGALYFRDNAGGQYYNSAFINYGGHLGMIEGTPGENETSGERTATSYALGDLFDSPTGAAPAGNCVDPGDLNDLTTRATTCADDGDCPGGAVCVLHYQARPGTTFELEFEDNEYFCFGNPDPENIGSPGLITSGASAAAAAGSNRAHTDPGVFSNAALDNNYTDCGGSLPIRSLVRLVDPFDFPLGDGVNQPIASVDPLPAAGSPLLTTDHACPEDGFFEPAPYKGAFGDHNWADGWTVTSQLGFFPSARECTTYGNPCFDDADCPSGETCVAANVVMVDDDITMSQTWTADNEYVLTGIRYILGGATLTIEPGTVVRSEPNERRCAVDGDVCSVDADCTDGSDNADPCLNDPGTLIVTRGSRIEAQGTADMPIVFTNLEDDNVGASLGRASSPYSDLTQALQINSTWGGVIMLGRGYVANDTDTTPPAPDPRRELIIEGLQDRGRCSETFTNCRLDGQCTGGSDVCDLGVNFYGNCAATLSPDQCDDDNSGTMRYVTMRHGGFELGSANEINGLTLGAVGRGTTLDYIEVFGNFDDGVELFGGAVDIKHFVLVNNGDDDVDYDEGWRGRGQFIFAEKGVLISSDPRGGEHDGATGGDSGQPRAAPTIYNATYVGAGGTGTGTANDDFYDPAEDYGAQQDANGALYFRDNAGGQYYNSAFINYGGHLGMIEGTPGENETSGERTATSYALGDLFDSPAGAAPAGNCVDPGDLNDLTTRATTCADDGDCPGGAVCVLHYQARPGTTFELEFEDNEYFCFGNPDPENTGSPGLITSGASAAAAAGSNRAHTDPGVFSNAALDNNYTDCGGALPIRSLVRLVDSFDFPLGDGVNQPIASIDPRPAPGSPLWAVERIPPADGFFTDTWHKGAFGGDNWAAGWSHTSRLGSFPTCDTATGIGPVPDEVKNLVVGAGDDGARFDWNTVTRQGLRGTQGYDLLRSTDGSDFSGATCLVSNANKPGATDADDPGLNGVFYYLARSTNPCGDGSLGQRPDGTTRTGATCP
jgi:hypothetical protein